MLLLSLLPLSTLLLLMMLLITHQVACFLVDTYRWDPAALLNEWCNHTPA